MFPYICIFLDYLSVQLYTHGPSSSNASSREIFILTGCPCCLKIVLLSKVQTIFSLCYLATLITNGGCQMLKT